MDYPILVTGASTRVGLELAKHLASTGNLVISASRSAPDCSHARISHFQADLQKEPDRQALIEHIKQNFPGLRAIIHNASLWLEDGIENLQTMFQLHVEAPYHLNLALAEALRAPGKSDIIHICDESASRGSSKHIAYAATKAALQNMMLSFADKYAPHIRVNAISPGLLIFKENSSHEYQQRALKKAALQFEPGATPLIQAVEYLLGSHYSTGSNIVINGGRHLKKEAEHD